MRKRNFSFWGFVGPILLAYIIVQLIPLVIGIYYSFTDWNGINSDVKLIGIQNYVDVFKDPTFKQSFWFTFKFTVLSIIVLNALGFGLALLVTRESKICNVLRTVFFMPNLIGGVILGFIWQFIFTQVFSVIGKVF